MPALDDTLRQKIAVLESKHQKRVLRDTLALSPTRVRRGGRELVSFSGNDYLGLSRHPEVLAAAQKAIAEEGAGAGASRLVTGNHLHYAKLETALASYKSTEAACVFGSGYLANLGIITALMGKGDLIIADKLSHACILDAARLSGASVMRFAHNNPSHLRMILEGSRREYHHCLIVTETVFSMDGDIAPMAQLRALADEFDAWLMTDDAHGLGVLPPQEVKADIQMGTLSKGAGCYGGYVCGSQALIDYLANAARSLIFSTGLPPSVVAAGAAALGIISSQPALVAKPLAKARYFTQLMELPEAQSAIVPLVLHENDKALALASYLEENGFLVAAIRPPTVPENTARLRFAFCAEHDDADIQKLAQLLKEKEAGA
jgi:8-amino-7-oxononanoate synthase